MDLQNKSVLVVGSGISGIAVISAVFAQKDITCATQNLRHIIEEIAAYG